MASRVKIKAVQTAALESALDKHISDYRAFLKAAIVSIQQLVSKSEYLSPRTTMGDVAHAVHESMKLPDYILEWRVSAMISTAYKLGAFGDLIEIRQGCGIQLVNPKKDRVLRLVK